MTAVRTENPYLIAFLTLNGFTAQSRRVADAELADTLDDYFALVASNIEEAGGIVVKFIGDGVLAVFPQTNADSGVTALLSLKPAADQFMQDRHWDCRLIVRVHFGDIIAGPIGPGKHRRFDVIGREVNVAARLESTGVTLSVEAFRQLGTETRKRFKRHMPPVTYIRVEEPHRRSTR
jgi:adenylate cyclase